MDDFYLWVLAGVFFWTFCHLRIMVWRYAEHNTQFAGPPAPIPLWKMSVIFAFAPIFFFLLILVIVDQH